MSVDLTEEKLAAVQAETISDSEGPQQFEEAELEPKLTWQTVLAFFVRSWIYKLLYSQFVNCLQGTHLAIQRLYFDIAHSVDYFVIHQR